jgi:hypothetical protein
MTTPTSDPNQPPIPEYETLTVEQITEWAATATPAERAAAVQYERAHQNRADVLKVLSSGAGSPPVSTLPA